MLSELRDAAIRNNADWCDTMAAGHGVPVRRTARAWLADAAMPPFYPNAVTLAPGIAPAALAPDLPALPGGWGLKDSFRDLDLAPLGFTPLFDASWIARPAGPWPALPAARPVTDAAGLARWAAAWGEGGPAIFVPALLADPRAGFFAVEVGGTTTAGIAVMRSAGVLGFSNAFGPPEAIAACLAALGDALPIVGYEAPADARALAPLGFCTTGALRVWTRPASAAPEVPSTAAPSRR